jgi:hypothetical protein
MSQGCVEESALMTPASDGGQEVGADGDVRVDPGAGVQAVYWSLLVPELQSRVHEAIVVDIAEDDPAAAGRPSQAIAVLSPRSIQDGLARLSTSNRWTVTYGR